MSTNFVKVKDERAFVHLIQTYSKINRKNTKI